MVNQLKCVQYIQSIVTVTSFQPGDDRKEKVAHIFESAGWTFEFYQGKSLSISGESKH